LDRDIVKLPIRSEASADFSQEKRDMNMKRFNVTNGQNTNNFNLIQECKGI
jgi:hypothetical protein